MNSRRIGIFSNPVVVAACILSLGLIVAALIDSHKDFHKQSASIASPVVAAPLSETVLREKFVSQLQAEYAGQAANQFGKSRTLVSVTVDEVKYAPKGGEIYVDYETHWKPEVTDLMECTLTKNDFGHWTNAYDIYDSDAGIHPHVDIQ